MKKNNSLVYIVLSALLLGAIACSKKSDNSLDQTVISISGKAQMGPISAAKVELYCVGSSGAIEGSSLGSTTTASDGSFSVSLTEAPSCSVLAVLTRGSYKEESSGNTIDIGTGQMRALLGGLDSASEIASITALSEIAAERFETIASEYSNLPAEELEKLMNRANEEIRVAAGLPEGYDITEVIPADPLAPVSNVDAPENKMALFLAGLSELAGDNSSNSMAFLATFATDFTDGDFDNGNWQLMDDKITEWIASPENSGGFVAPSAPLTPIAMPVIDSTTFPPPDTSGLPTGSAPNTDVAERIEVSGMPMFTNSSCAGPFKAILKNVMSSAVNASATVSVSFASSTVSPSGSVAFYSNSNCASSISSISISSGQSESTGFYIKVTGASQGSSVSVIGASTSLISALLLGYVM